MTEPSSDMSDVNTPMFWTAKTIKPFISKELDVTSSHMKIESFWPRVVTVQFGIGGWWAHMEATKYPFGNCRMDRGPYPFRWMAALAFPIQRWTW